MRPPAVVSTVVGALLFLLSVPGCGELRQVARDRETPEEQSEPERRFGFVLAVDISQSPAILTFDPAEWITGDAADEAAAEDGVIAPGEQVPNDYYIRNPSKEREALPIREEVEIVLEFWRGSPGEEKTVDVETFAGFFEEDTEPPDAGMRFFPYWVIVDDGSVVLIEQQYVP